MVFQRFFKNKAEIIKQETLKTRVGSSTLFLILKLIRSSGKFILKSQVIVGLRDEDIPEILHLMQIGTKEMQFSSKDEALEEYESLLTLWKLQNL